MALANLHLLRQNGNDPTSTPNEWTLDAIQNVGGCTRMEQRLADLLLADRGKCNSPRLTKIVASATLLNLL